MTGIQQGLEEKDFADWLQERVGRRMALRWNENLSTMISIREGRGQVRVSLHRMFRTAPTHVVEELVRYIQGKRKSPGPILRGFIEENFQKLDYGDRLSKTKLEAQGRIFDLQDIFDRLNARYFEGKLDLKITWYGRLRRRACSHVTFGLYWDPLKLIKIHRLLDDPRVPHYVVSFVVYHEMLHAVYPAYVDENGCHRVHHPVFQAQEKRFRYYKAATKWIADNQTYIFGGRR